MTLAQDLRLAVGRLARRLRRLYTDGDDNLTFLELAVLQRLERLGPASPGELAGHEHVTSAAIAPVLRRLEAHAFVTRAADPADGRRSVMSISLPGRTALQTREAASIARIHDALSTLTPAQRQLLADAIPLLEKVTAQL
ncbi:MarR family transcriptional regulator [Dactylosporangium vinaceum]|uniref:MarR family winged helix-turn-helix transcriptional regulator n=1 Tax=Dactylosporangium vinaceum TaxID=53362 RepID=A0ABV5MMQ5_9ACTN|nr:MarR family transcriptional regulator [Dactylosporangium vinaceum]UAB92257.1 MarR family transcriptional regulator [Dactylosporangium vinaceum]